VQVTEAIRARRAVRSFTGEAVDGSMLRALIDAAIQAPSALNAQPGVRRDRRSRAAA
jgi:nitroreductase